jgi:hypothetical protein
MATAQQIIDSATLKLGLRPQGTTYDSFDSSANNDAFTVLQDLVAQLTADNCLHIPTPSSTTDTLDLYEEQVKDLKSLLARDLMVEFRIAEAGAQLMREISSAEDRLDNDNTISLEVEMPLGFSYKYDVTSDV